MFVCTSSVRFISFLNHLILTLCTSKNNCLVFFMNVSEHQALLYKYQLAIFGLLLDFGVYS